MFCQNKGVAITKSILFSTYLEENTLLVKKSYFRQKKHSHKSRLLWYPNLIPPSSLGQPSPKLQQPLPKGQFLFDTPLYLNLPLAPIIENMYPIIPINMRAYYCFFHFFGTIFSHFRRGYPSIEVTF